MTRWPAEWGRYCQLLCPATELGVTLDVSRVRMGADAVRRLEQRLRVAFDAMDALEVGAVANGDEGRMVGHYWLRSPELAPNARIRDEIREGLAATKLLAERIRNGEVTGRAGEFTDFLHVGVGGSTVGPQLLCEALDDGGASIAVQFLDNADPDGLDRALRRITSLGRTLVSVVSKSGITPTPWHVMLELEAHYRRAGLDLARHAVAISVSGSDLDLRATSHNWLARLPLWDWVGGRTSVTSAVGLLPAALVGADVDRLVAGAAAMDRYTRSHDLWRNPAALLALAWYVLGDGHGRRNMVVMPYSDRLAELARWIQQLVMESVGKRLDRAGGIVRQGLTVYGHKGASDQHSYLQQLREGPDDFFVTFIGIQRERAGPAIEVMPGTTLGDHLFGGLEGTRAALYDGGRDSITLTLPDVGSRSLGALVALFERAVGLYAELIDVNAYHQPSVDKHIAVPILDLQHEALRGLRAAGAPRTAEQLAVAIRQPDRVETLYKLLDRLAINRRSVARVAGSTPLDTQFTWRPDPD